MERQKRPISFTFTGFGSFVLPTPLSSDASFCCLLLFLLVYFLRFFFLFSSLSNFHLLSSFFSLCQSSFLPSFCFNFYFLFCFLLFSFFPNHFPEGKKAPTQTSNSKVGVYFPRKSRAHRKQDFRGDPKMHKTWGKWLDAFF